MRQKPDRVNNDLARSIPDPLVQIIRTLSPTGGLGLLFTV